MDIDVITYTLLFFTAVFAGFVDSIAGGGGIVTVPMLLALGIPPHYALGTNKLQASFGSFTATMRYWHGKLIRRDRIAYGVIFTFLGAMAGAVSIQVLSVDFLEQLIPLLLLVIFLYVLLQPKVGLFETKASWPLLVFYIVFGLSLGFYDGFFGPGTGSLWTLGFVALCGFNLKYATGHTKAMNFTSNLASLLMFIIGGNVLFFLGLLMGAGQFCGAWLGSHMVIRYKVGFIRTFFLFVVGITVFRLILRSYFGI